MTKILLVEDDKSLREIYGVRLLAEGYDIVSAGDGEEALAVAIRERPDLIISDVMMPKISGFEMLDLLRSNDATKNIKVIMMTALSSDTQRERGESLGADRYLVKSQVGIEDVVRTVHEVLGDRNEQGQPIAAPAAPTTAEAADDPGAQPKTDSIDPTTATANVFRPAPETTVPSLPAPNQSAFNPVAATAPNEVVGVPAPALPAEPISVPTTNNAPAQAPTLPPIAPPPADDNDSAAAPAATQSSDDATQPASAQPPAAPTSTPEPPAEEKEVPSFQPSDNDNSEDDKPAGAENKPSVDLTQSGRGLGSRVIQPIGEGVTQKIDLGNLLAKEETKNLGLDPENLSATQAEAASADDNTGEDVTIKPANAAASTDGPILDEVDAHAQLAEAAEAAQPPIPPVGENNTIVFPSQQ